jgi:predicted metal-dependent phosphoesterase TrpH
MNQPGQAIKMMRVDLHCHTETSWDCSTPISLFPDRCRERKIAVQAITDHDEIWGAQRLKALVEEQNDPLTIIIGEEITTREGEIIGLFLKEKIEPGLSPEEAVAQIKGQGGLVLLPHGFDRLKRGRLATAAIGRIAAAIDIVETFNTRISHPRYNREAALWAQARGLPMSGGSDAHTLADVGSAWVEVPAQAITGPDDLLRALTGHTPTGDWTHPVLAYAYKTWDRLRRRFNTPVPKV